MRALVGLATALLAAAGALAEERLALVIGNGAYPPEVGALHNTEQDARTIAAALKEVGFTLVTGGPVLDADKARIELAVLELQQALTASGPEAIGFLYYSGHGGSYESNGLRSNYLIPSGAPITGAQQLPLLGVSLSTIADALASTGARGVFIVSDACRNTLPFTSSRGGAEPDRGFVAVGAAAGVYIAHATADGQTAPDDGAFAAALAEQIVAPNLTADRAFTLAFRAVSLTRTGYRRPTSQDGLREDICFVSCPEDVSIDKDVIETAYFQASQTCTDFQSYLERYPQGSFEPLARSRAGELCAAPDAPSDPASVDEQADSLSRFLAQLDRGDPNFDPLDALYEVEAAYGLDALHAAADGGDSFAALIVASSYSAGVFVERDFERAFGLFQRSCDGGSTLGCAYLGGAYQAGRGVAPNYAEAIRLQVDSCDGGAPRACAGLGFAHSRGLGVPRDDALAARYFRMACDRGSAVGCGSLAGQHLTGAGVPHDEAEARRLFASACDGGEPMSCNTIAWLLATSPDPSSRDGVEAVRFAQTAVRKAPNVAAFRDTLAAALAEAGDFTQAAAEQQRAIDLDASLPGGQERLALYQSGQAYREEP